MVSGSRKSCLSIFYEEIGFDNKKRMVKALDKIDTSENSVKKFEIFPNDVENFLTKGIENFILQKTRGFFDRFSIPMDFLQKDPIEWEDDNSFQIGLEIIKKLKVVNDTAERGVKLMEVQNTVKPFQEAKKRNNISCKLFQNIGKNTPTVWNNIGSGFVKLHFCQIKFILRE